MFRGCFRFICIVAIAGRVLGINFGCPASGWNVNDHDSTHQITYYRNIQSWQSCGRHCKDFDGCLYWSYNTGHPSPKDCVLFSKITKIVAVNERTSGAKNCS